MNAIVRQRLAKFAPTELAVDPKLLSEEDRQVVNKLIAAARIIDDIFWKQSYPQGIAHKEQLERSTFPEDKDYLRFLQINFGPFDRQDENRPFLGTGTKPAGAKAGVQTSAFVLPNDEQVREKKGTKKVFLKNMMEAKFAKSLVPISQRVLEPADAQKVSFDAYFTEVILHEICHVLGLNYITLPDGTKTTVGKALKDLNTPIEEGKADVVGIASVPLLVGKGIIPKGRENEIYTTYLAGMFRVMRFGATEAHGLGVLIQYNYLREKGAFVFDPASRKFRVDLTKIKAAVQDLARQFLVLEGDGNYDAAKAFKDKYGAVDDITKAVIEKLKDIPVDIAPIFRTEY